MRPEGRGGDVEVAGMTRSARAPCPLCADGKMRALRTVDGIGLRSCTSCGSVIADVPAPQPSAYGAVYYERSYIAFRDERLAFLRRLVGCLGDASGRIALDSGCGAGLSLDVLAGTGWRAVGIEPSPAGASLAARRGHAVVRASASGLPTATRVAGAVLLLDVLAHLDDPAAAVREAARVLAPGGRILVKTPHRPSWAYWLAGRLPGRVGRGLMHLPHQRFAISRQALATLLTAAGFEDVELRPSREAIALRSRLCVSWALKVRVVLAAAFELFYGMPSWVATGTRKPPSDRRGPRLHSSGAQDEAGREAERPGEEALLQEVP